MHTTVGLPGGAKIDVSGGRELVRCGRRGRRAGAHLLAPGPTPAAGGWGMNSAAIDHNHCRAVEQAQQSLKFAARRGAWSYEEKSANRPTTVSRTASIRVLPSNPNRHLGSAGSRSQELIFNLSSPARFHGNQSSTHVLNFAVTASPMPTTRPPDFSALLAGRRLLQESDALVFNLNRCGYARDLTSIKALPHSEARHTLLQVGLTDAEVTAAAVQQADPDLLMHLAAESHVDRAIEGPGASGSTSSPDCAYIDSNESGTFHLQQAVRSRWQELPEERQARFSETTPNDPRSPYSASKAGSDHLVNAWHHTYGPWQFPDKLIPVVILKAAAVEPIPLSDDGQNVRDFLYVGDHVDALLPEACVGKTGQSYGVGAHGECNNKQVVEAICKKLDALQPAFAPHAPLITQVTDSPSHDRRYAIDPTLITAELGWSPRHSFVEGLSAATKGCIINPNALRTDLNAKHKPKSAQLVLFNSMQMAIAERFMSTE